MQLNDDVHVLPLPMVRDGQTRILNLSLILDPAEGPTLVDTGLPGQLDTIAAVMADAGVGVGDLKRIVLTHQDIDHVGSLRQLVDASGAQVLAHEVEVPFIDGTERPRFARPEVLASRPSCERCSSAFSRHPSTSCFTTEIASTWHVACVSSLPRDIRSAISAFTWNAVGR